MNDDYLEGKIRRWISKASRAPSAHNTQPAQWHIGADGKIYLIENLNRHLKIADSSKHDQYIALGAAYEGLKIAASEDGYALAEPEFEFDYPGKLDECEHKAFAMTQTSGNVECDPLASAVDTRVTYRGLFAKPDEVTLAAFMHWADDQNDIRILQASGDIADIAKRYDRCALAFAKDRAYYQELYRWLRFNRRHPDWDKDGLNADALSLAAMERIFGAFVVHPTIFNVWKSLGLAGLFVSEKTAIQSAPFVIIFTCDKKLSPFDTGRYFYRIWLQLTSLGLLLCPMSALSDHPDGRQFIEQRWPIAEDKRLVNIFRAGVAPSGSPKPTPRLPLSELLV